MIMIVRGIAAGICVLIAGGAAQAQDCNTAGAQTVVTVPLSGSPFSAIPTSDGCTVFVSLGGPQGGRIVVMRRAGGRLAVAHEVKLPSGSPAGMRLSPDGRVLAAANVEGVVLYDAARLAAGDAAPLAMARSEAPGSSIAASTYVGISPDNRLLFVADEQVEAITVYDLPRLRGGDTQAIGRIPVGRAPVGLVFSPDGRTLYSTSQQQAGGKGAATCRPPLGAPAGAANTTPGSLFVIDVATAAKNPAQSVSAKVDMGCDPVRVELSPDGRRAYITARSQNTLEIFDTTRLISDGPKARIASIPVGSLPVGVAVAGNRVIVGNSNRLAPNSRLEWLSVIDSATNQVVGDIPAGGFPREMNLTADGKTLLVTNFASQSVSMIDLAGLTPAYFAAQKAAKSADDAVRARAAADLRARIVRGQASPGAEAALRKIILGLQSGMPDLTLIANPQLAVLMQRNQAQSQQRLQEWGALQSITFDRIGPAGGDNFIVVFEKQRTRWAIGMAPDGRIQNLGFGSLPPE
jgi:DNA-binding beta-propeller fold protein YncE